MFECLGKTILHMGDHGAGQITKACNQLALTVTAQAAAEALSLARGCGLDPDRVLEAMMGGVAASRVLELFGRRMAARDFATGIDSRLYHKDLGIALDLAQEAGLPMPAMLEALESFPGLPHRSQWIADVAGVRYVYDSKGTNVGATIAAVAGMPGPLVMIAGGQGKGQDFAPLGPAFRGKVRHAVLIGQDAALLAAALEGVCSVERAASMGEAVGAAARAARVGDTVLLSPACASLDMFRDYGQRGEAFAAAVRGLL